MHRARAASTGRMIADGVLAVLACAGAACIALVVAALAFDVSIMLFATGSMSPTIPAGSAALVREIPASEVRTGDVVTVDRPGLLPVTHRVVAIGEPASGIEGHRALTLRGDANPVDDPAPYDVGTVRVVMWSVPGVAPVIAGLGNPLVLGGLTIAMSALVLWAFWPHEPRGPRAGRSGRRRAGSAGSGPGAARRAAGVSAAALAAAALVAGAPPTSAQAAPVEEVIQGRYITLTTIADPARMTTLSPGDTATLLLGVGTVAEAPGVVRLDLDIDAIETRLELRVVECDGAPSSGSCADGRTVLAGVPLDAPADGIPLGEVPGHAGRWLRFDVTAPEAGLAQGVGARLTVHATGFGEIVETGTDDTSGTGPLAASGADASGRILLAGGAIALGLAAAHLARRGRRRGGVS
jgi:signal peptidase